MFINATGYFIPEGRVSNDHFFEIVGEMGCKVILGIDAHDPNDFNDEIFETLNRFVNKHHLNIIDSFKFRKGK